MKKFILILMCTSMLGFLACNKDEEENTPDFDPATVIPEDYLNMIKQSMPLYTGEAPRVRGHIVFDAEVLYGMSGKYKEGDKLGSKRKSILDKYDGTISMIAGPSAAHTFTMNGPVKVYGSGENFSIYGTLKGNGARGRKEYEILYVVSGRQVITGTDENRKYEIKELQYAYVVLWNETSNSFRGVEDAGTFYITKPVDAESYSYSPW